jgi:short subunit dehydrogenase-like uncharacterized protein
MARSGFMIYGAYGYTGELIVRSAIERGHRPLLAGRDPVRLGALARQLDLPSVVLGLEDAAALAGALEAVQVVCHAAGPFVRTAPPMLRACLEAGTSYVDITGEIPVFEAAFALHAQAVQRGVALLPGAGFDVVPTDCLARFVADAVPGATELELALLVQTQPSRGTLRSSFEGILRGNFVRRDGELQPLPFGQGLHTVRFTRAEHAVLPVPWGDLETAFHTTGIGNITVSMAVPSAVAKLLGVAAPFVPRLLGLAERTWLQRAVLAAIERQPEGPDARARGRGRAEVWARAMSPDGRTREAWLEVADGYAFTAESAVLAVEALLAAPHRGALTPAGAFGADFVLGVRRSRRFEALPAPE